MVVFGCMSLVAMLAMSFLPESKDKEQLDEIEEVTELEKDHSLHTQKYNEIEKHFE